jgi:hypothetical protein
MERVRQFQWLIIAVVVCATVVVVVLLLRPQPNSPTVQDFTQRAHEAEVACLQGGGSWIRDPHSITGSGFCSHLGG